MISFWDGGKPDALALTLPERLSDGETVRLLGNAFDVMTAVLIEGVAIGDAAICAGYREAARENLTPLLKSESFVHARQEHRLNLRAHCYSNYVRRVLQLTIPGGMTLDALERFRKARGCVGCTYHWHAHIYGEWRTEERLADACSPIFIELRQDVFQGEPLLLRVEFHQVASD